MAKQPILALQLGMVLAAVVVAVLFLASKVHWNHGDEADKVAASTAPAKKHLNLSYKFSAGWLVSHDLYITNTSGERLSEVHLEFTLLGEDGSPSVTRYWSAWPLGGQQLVSIPVERVKNVQRIRVSGYADQGMIETTVQPDK
jgi:hypothetical protein